MPPTAVRVKQHLELALRPGGFTMRERGNAGKGSLAKEAFQDEFNWGKGASARTQVYLSKTKLTLQVGI